MWCGPGARATTTPRLRWSRTYSTRTRGSSRYPGSGCLPPATPASSTTAVQAQRERPSPTPSRRTRCTSSRAATTPRTTCRTSSAAWAAIRRSCSMVAVRRRSCCAATPGVCGPVPDLHGDHVTPGKCCATHMSGGCPAGWRSTKPSTSKSRRVFAIGRPETEDQQTQRDHGRCECEHRCHDESRHRRADDGTAAHCENNAEPQLFAGAGSTGQSAVHAEADDGRRQHCGGELWDPELASSGMLQTERHCEAADQDELGVV